MLIQNKDIIVVGLQAWDSEIGSNCKNIALEFCRHNRVLYVNYALDRISAKREKNNPAFQSRFKIIKHKTQNLFKVNKNLWNLFPASILESANWIPFTFLFRIVNKWNNRRFAKDIKKAIEALNFKDYILFNDSDMFRSFYLKELLHPTVTVYYTRDNLMGVPYWYKHGHIIEPELFAKSDVVTANSNYLANVAKKYNSHSFYVGQGCETEDFDRDKITFVPDDIKDIKGPVIGYIGALFNLRLDLKMLEQLANHRPDWSFVFIGPQDAAFEGSSLHQKSNVYFLGLKDAGKLPAYLAKFDVALNPQKVNEVTIGNYPRKIDEYLAMGKAVVATRTEAMDVFADYVYFASSAADYEVQIEKALKENNAELENARIYFAKRHTWENSVAEIYKAILTARPEYLNHERQEQLINSNNQIL